MPLKKLATNGSAATAEAPVTAQATINVSSLTPLVAPKAAPKQMAPKVSKADTKENYWERKEDRDIETGKRIRRSGVWQAALQSMAGLQFNQAGTVESYLALVDKLAEHGLNWVNKD